MKKIFIFILLSFSLSWLMAQELTLENINAGRFSPARIYGVNPLADGESYSQLSSDLKKVVRRSFKTGEQTAVLFDVNETTGDIKLDRIDGYIMSPDEQTILVQTNTNIIYRHSFTAEYYIYNVSSRQLKKLSQGGAQQAPQFSPNGEMIAFARQGDLYVARLSSETETRITYDGERNKIINGIPDWVNEEEFSTDHSFCFTADSKTLCWVRYDESHVPVYSIPMYKGQRPEIKAYDEYPGTYDYKYPVAGADNARVTVHSFDISTSTTRQIIVPLDADGYIPRIMPAGQTDAIVIATLNRHQDRMELYKAYPRTAACTLILRETDDKYLRESAYSSLTFYGDEFVLTSGRTGFEHLYLYSIDGTLKRALTQGAYDVTNFYGYQPSTGKVFYQAADESPLRRNVLVGEKNGKVRKLSTETGTNDAIFSSNFKYHLNVFSSAEQPYVTTLRDAKGKTLTTLLDNAELRQLTDSLCGKKEFFTITTADGIALNGWMVKPRNFDPTKQYPLVMFQYSGPGSQEVLDSWRMGQAGGGLFESYMAARGYIVACVDGRGTGARGVEFEKCTYLHLGQLESHDQAEAAICLGKLPYIDAERIGIWGWSFGGFNTLMSMSEGRNLFKAGVAVAAPTNWKYYDTVYTERFMRTPAENPGYDDNPISRAPKLHGSLLIIHGSADDNVHYRNFAEYTEALVQNGKQFDMHVYTNRNHFIYGGQTRNHLYHRITDFFFKNL